jgi:hypothetical protein
MSRLSDINLDEILKNIEERKPYVDRYYIQFGKKPDWIGGYNPETPDFEAWYLAEKRNDKLNKLGL